MKHKRVEYRDLASCLAAVNNSALYSKGDLSIVVNRLGDEVYKLRSVLETARTDLTSVQEQHAIIDDERVVRLRAENDRLRMLLRECRPFVANALVDETVQTEAGRDPSIRLVVGLWQKLLSCVDSALAEGK